MDYETSIQAKAEVLLPEHMIDGAVQYVLRGQQPGGFHRAILENKLHDAASKADQENQMALFRWAQWLSHIPISSWGSKEAVDKWIADGGWLGKFSK